MNKVDRKRVSDHFRRSIPTYDQDAIVQKEVGSYLVKNLEKYPEIRFERVLEIGCCTGSMTEMLCKAQDVANIWVNDLVKECAISAADRISTMVVQAHIASGDIEQIALPENLDLVISSSTFQWVQNLPECFEKIALALHDSGYLVFSMFGVGTMQQVRELLGVGLSYVTDNELSDMLANHFIIEDIEVLPYQIYFSTPRDVLRHIQKTGVGGVVEYRWTPSRLKAFEKRYRECYGDGKGIPVSYNAINVVARKK